MNEDFLVKKFISCSGIVIAFLVWTAVYGPKVEEEVERLRLEFPNSQDDGIYRKILFARTLGAANKLAIGLNGCKIYYLDPNNKLDSLKVEFLGLEAAMNQLNIKSMKRINGSYFVNKKFGCFCKLSADDYKMIIPDIDSILAAKSYYPFDITKLYRHTTIKLDFKACELTK